MKHIIIGSLVVAAALAPAIAFAERGQMLRPPIFGRVREVVGDDLPLVAARDNCPAAAKPMADGPCFDTIKATATPQRVLTLLAHYRSGERVTGEYGRDFQLYEVRQGAKGIEARTLPLPTSDVRVPRGCYKLNGEDVGYVLDTVNGAAVAQESQYVICDGGPDSPRGPYRPSGPVMRSDSGGWGPSQTVLAEGQHRYLAVPDSSCDPAYVIRDSYCAKPAVVYMNANPDVKELDLVAALAPVKADDVLGDKDLKQWVMKRNSKGYKADGRWFAKSMFTDGNGCWSSEPVRWYVGAVPDGLDITEKAMSRCGAPAAPVPTALFMVYGQEYDILNCSGGGCAGPATDALKAMKRKSATFVTLSRPGYGRVTSGYEIVDAELKDDGVKLRSSYASISESGCTDSSGPDSQGVEVYRRTARAFRLMECTIY